MTKNGSKEPFFLFYNFIIEFLKKMMTIVGHYKDFLSIFIKFNNKNNLYNHKGGFK